MLDPRSSLSPQSPPRAGEPVAPGWGARGLWIAWCVALAAGCDEGAAAPTGDAAALARASLDLRGIRPSPEEIAAIEADPEIWSALVSGFMDDPRFGAQLRELFREIYLTQNDEYPARAADFGLEDEASFAAAVGEEPLWILSQIAEQDLPWTTLTTADWTVVDEQLAAGWPTDYPEGESGWRQVRYSDGRPHAGVLSTNGMWWNYKSTRFNANRARANAITRILLCHDHLSKPVTFSAEISLNDEDETLDAILTDPGCVSCHVTLEPIASYLYGFFYNFDGDDYGVQELTRYHPEREPLWSGVTGVAPGYYGEPGYTLSDLGLQIASDPRMVSCAVEQSWSLLLRRSPSTEDEGALSVHRERFEEGGLTVRALFSSILDSEDYRERTEGGEPALKLLSPPQYASAVEALTGFRFTRGGYDLLQSELYGARTLVGGANGGFAIEPDYRVAPSYALVQAQIAEGAALYAVTAEPERLFEGLRFDEDPEADRALIVAQLQALHLRLFSVRVSEDSAEVADALALWSAALAASGSQEQAWAAVLAVMLRDPLFIFY